MHYFSHGFEIEDKGVGNLVTEADKKTERTIVELIKAEFSEHKVLAEEEHSASVTAEHLWIIDPIDGTNNFAHGIPQFAVSVAYYYQGQAMVGVVLNPSSGELFSATRGGGAFLNGEQIKVSEATALNQVVIGTGFYYDRGKMMERTLQSIRDLFARDIHGMRRLGAASLDLCFVAAGRFGAYFEYQLAPWDFAAARLIVEEAGGVVTQANGEVLPLDHTTIAASNGAFHAELVSCLKTSE
ncbi:UNVERIFIED_CONTAM: hypothetical protein GTU68_065227 [Idotea baltica]|nr:hypothetical protein [Idotea baltica]